MVTSNDDFEPPAKLYKDCGHCAMVAKWCEVKRVHDSDIESSLWTFSNKRLQEWSGVVLTQPDQLPYYHAVLEPFCEPRVNAVLDC